MYKFLENDYNKDVKIWCNKEIECSALEQINNMIEHEGIKRIAIMPDVHAGKGVCIGTVALTSDIIIPNMVGVDIGCGMYAVKTNIKVNEVDNFKNKLQTVMDILKQRIPVGFAHRGKIIEDIREFEVVGCICENEVITNNAFNQIGTIGSGNHFNEINVDEDGYLWFVIHSGSRNLGKKVCDYYNGFAKSMCSKYYQNKIVKNDLAFIPIGTELAEEYLKEMGTCMRFAEENRYQIAKITFEVISLVFGYDTEKIEEIETMHNFCRLENHYGENYYVHRKGAICANGKVIIPGNQRDGTYICIGLNNKVSYCSASHGSGRKLSRAMAKKTLDLESVQKNMGNIIHNITSVEQLDEAAEAYKNIDDVINAESDLVKPIHRLHTLAVMKG